MNLKEFKKAGHWPTLLAAFLYFDVSFMAWVTLGPLAVYIAQDLNIPYGEQFTMVAIPILAGAILRVPMGIFCDHFGAKVTGSVAQLIVIAAVAYTWLVGLNSPFEIHMLGVVLGLGGASFAVALPQASKWYPPQYQGIVLGIAGAGNMGVVLDALFIPTLAEHYGWRVAIGSLLVPLVPTFLFYVMASKEAPVPRNPVTWAKYKAVFADRDSWWFMFFYFITFGGFVGLANSLPLYFTIQYHVSGVTAGLMVAIIVMFGSCFRPIGGYVADRIGGIRTLLVLFAVVSATYLLISFLPGGAAPASGGWSMMQMPMEAWIAVLVFSVGVLCLGMGNGAVFQLIPQRFRGEMGVMTGLVGCMGGIGGFFLAKTLGMSKEMTGEFSLGFLFFSVMVLGGWLALLSLKTRWRTTWGAASGARI
ncbi:NarK/NasA family nitrate transporter [Telmatospirillum sp. J64-1]|uniref:nitrate/nitrite transporter n=1 Tax=Telmatospirillum sp. J64-1 TaxID=2502183 RepID=UPI00115CBCD1|nr:nitrate/nitrite transporter [Telmatospirillum sp. J64-1]